MRTTKEKVRQIIDTEITDANVEGYIEAASTVLDEVFAGVTISSTMLTEIERWLTAHFISSTKERQAKKEGAGGAFIEYAGEYEMGLQSTSYGQNAMTLDYTGTLRGLAGKTASITAIKQ